MYNLRAFVTIPALVNNQPDVDSPLGELSATAKTYSREVGIYKTQDHPNTILHSFHSAVDGTLTKVDPMIVASVLDVAEFLYNRAIDGTLSDDKAACQQLLLAQFGGTVQFNLVGRMVTNGTYWLPETLTVALVAQGENEIKLWFADAAFRSQYDHYEIVVVPPVVPLDDLHGQRAVVLTLLSQITVSGHVTKVNQLIAQDPQTYLISHEYDWVDKNDPSIKKATPWTVIVYGVGGNNDDVIREALVNYILANSQFPRSEWEKIYPDLFLPLEFYMTPLWDRYSLTNMLTVAGVYSPTVPWREVMRYALGTFYNQTFQHCSEYVATTQSTYKSLSLVAVGNSRNRNGIFGLETLWPQYAAISTQHGDFGRMSPETQQFSLMLTQALVHAEELTPTSAIPEGYSRVKRGEFWYLAKTFNKVLYLFWLKYNDFPEVDVPELPDFSQYRLTLSLVGNPGNQTIQGVVSQDGTPGPISAGIPIDWFVTGDWFTTEQQDGSSTIAIPALVTNTDTGSGIHTVRVEFVGSAGPVELTGQVQLLPIPAAAENFTLHLEYVPGNLLLAELRNNGVFVPDWDYDIVNGAVTFTADPIPGTEQSAYVVQTALTRYGVAIDNEPWLGEGGVPATRTVHLTFTHADGRTIELTNTIQTPATPTANAAGIDWTYDNFVDTNEVEHRLFAINTNDSPPSEITGVNILEWNLWLGDGRYIDTDMDDNGDRKHDRTFRHGPQTRMLMTFKVSQDGVDKWFSQDFLWFDFTAWQN